VRIDAGTEPLLCAVTPIQLELNIGNVGDNDPAPKAVKGLCEASGARANVQDTTPGSHKPFEEVIVDVFMNGTERESIKTLPFARAKLIEVGFNSAGLVSHDGLAA